MKHFVIEPVKTYATRENAIKAVEKKFGKLDQPSDNPSFKEQRFFIMTHTDGRFFPVFVGMQAIQAGVHFHFNVIG